MTRRGRRQQRRRAGPAPSAARATVDRWGGLVEFYFRFHAVLVYAFLYLPIVVVVLFAFNGTDRRRDQVGRPVD